MTIKFDAYSQNVNFPDQIHLSCHFSSKSESDLEVLNKSIRKLVSDLNQAKEDEKKKLEDEKKKLELAAKNLGITLDTDLVPEHLVVMATEVTRIPVEPLDTRKQ